MKLFCMNTRRCKSYPHRCDICKHNPNREKDDYFEPVDEPEKVTIPYIDPSGTNPNIKCGVPYVFTGKPLYQQLVKEK